MDAIENTVGYAIRNIGSSTVSVCIAFLQTDKCLHLCFTKKIETQKLYFRFLNGLFITVLLLESQAHFSLSS